MGWFTKKKQENLEKRLPEFPKFPDAPPTPQTIHHEEEPARHETPEYRPSFERQAAAYDIEQTREIREPFEHDGIFEESEKKNSPFLKRLSEKEVVDRYVPPPVEKETPVKREKNPFWRPPIFEQKEQEEFSPKVGINISAEDKPVFVKLEKYREAMASVEILKQKIKETEYILGKLEEIRTQEQTELETCQSNLDQIKERLIEIDKKLFEA